MQYNPSRAKESCGRELMARAFDYGMFRVMGLTLVVAAVLAGCGSTTLQAQSGRVVMSEHSGWTIRVSPSFTDNGDRWRARVEVWPPDRSHTTHSGINVRFTDSAADEKTIVQSALASARRYIDASRTEHR
jgi:hypothetical protein